ncbi:MAG: hypothetical protein RL563_2203, partial [Pseudomonadota bacterium]
MTARHEIIFIDSRVDDYQELISNSPANSEIYVLSADRDGLEQMLDSLVG